MNKIIGIYRITNTVTGDFYIGSSKNIKQRLATHKWPSTWNEHPNNPMYLDMQKYGVDKFVFEILEEVEIEQLKEKEQQFIEKMHPIYNQMNAKGLNVERRKETNRKANNKYQKSDKGKETRRKYKKTDKGKESHKKANKKYDNQLCLYNGETLTLCALSKRFRRQGIDHPTIEAKKYLV